MKKFFANLSGLLARHFFNLLIIGALATILKPEVYASCMFSYSISGIAGAIFEYGYSITVPRVAASDSHWRNERLSIIRSKPILYIISASTLATTLLTIKDPLLSVTTTLAWHSYICLNSQINLLILHYRGKNRPETETKIIFRNNAASAALLILTAYSTDNPTAGILAAIAYKGALLGYIHRRTTCQKVTKKRPRSHSIVKYASDGFFVFLTMGSIHIENATAGTLLSENDFARFNLTNYALAGASVLAIAFSQYSVVRFSRSNRRKRSIFIESAKLGSVGLITTGLVGIVITLDPTETVSKYIDTKTAILLFSILSIRLAIAPLNAYLTASRHMRTRSIIATIYCSTFVLLSINISASINNMFSTIFVSSLIQFAGTTIALLCISPRKAA